jgi:hypothetical protein
VSDWQAALPAIAALRNEDLRERHWGAIRALLGAPMDQREGFSLSDMLRLGVRLWGRKKAWAGL